MCRCCCWCCCSRTHFLRCIFFCTENIYLLCRRHRCRQAGEHRAAYTEYTYRLYHINFDWINVCLWWTNIKQKKNKKRKKYKKSTKRDRVRRTVWVIAFNCVGELSFSPMHIAQCSTSSVRCPFYVNFMIFLLYFRVNTKYRDRDRGKPKKIHPIRSSNWIINFAASMWHENILFTFNVLNE